MAQAPPVRQAKLAVSSIAKNFKTGIITSWKLNFKTLSRVLIHQGPTVYCTLPSLSPPLRLGPAFPLSTQSHSNHPPNAQPWDHPFHTEDPHQKL